MLKYFVTDYEGTRTSDQRSDSLPGQAGIIILRCEHEQMNRKSYSCSV